jgi:electron transfer flavoprotein alpha subunit
MPKHVIFVEHDEKGIKKSSLSAILAARKIGGETHGILLGVNLKNPSDELAHYVTHVHTGEHDGLMHKLAQPYAKVLADVTNAIAGTHVWASATIAGKDLMPRVAARLNAGMASDIQEVINESTFIRPIWAGDINCKLELLSKIKVITVRVSEFAPAEKLTNAGNIVPVDVSLAPTNMRFISFDAIKSSRPELNDADVVVSGGRGLKSPEGFKELIEPLADVLHAAIGASRAVCDAGWVPNDWQVGQTGKVVAPKLYIAIGISGAIQHVAGIKGSRVIVAINKDPDAPIFQVADYGLVADAYKAVPELISLLKQEIQ